MAEGRQFEVRACRREDLPAVVELLLSGGRAAPGVTPSQIEAYAASVYFDSPWVGHGLASLVSVSGEGRIEGFVGVTARRMRLGDEAVLAAVPGNFVVRPGPDGAVNAFAALAMLKRLFAGPQDLTFTDTANDASRRLWEAAGAIGTGLQSLEWFRPIKPATALIQMMELARGAPPPMAAAVYVLTRTADLAGAPLLARMARNKGQPCALTALEPDALLQMLNSRDRRTTLAGVYEPDELDWLSRMIEAKAEGRALRRASVLDGQGARAGAFIYILDRRGVAQVLFHHAAEGRDDLVLQAALADAQRHGASLVTGAVQPARLPAYKAQRCFLMCNQWTLVHSRRAEILDAFRQGRARLTALDGERWTRFNDLFGI